MSIPNELPMDPLKELGQMLADAGAHPRINRSGLAPSILHDTTYHVAVIACAMRSHASGSRHRILGAWLKLLQFVAARPSLVANLRQYSQSKRGKDRDNWPLMPRGYLGDQTHDGVVELLVAARILGRDGDYLECADQFHVLDALASRVATDGMFVGERNILGQLTDLRPTKALMGGL